MILIGFGCSDVHRDAFVTTAHKTA